jgi:hypothetical protein
LPYVCYACLLCCSYLASLFTGDVPLPPVMCFAMGTLGFLTPFDATQYRCGTGPGPQHWQQAAVLQHATALYSVCGNAAL